MTKRWNQAYSKRNSSMIRSSTFDFLYKSIKLNLLDFLRLTGQRRDRTQTVFLSLYIVVSYQDKTSAWSTQSPNPVWRCQSMQTECLKQLLCILFAVFLGMQHILPSFGRSQLSFGAENHVQARCKFSSRTPESPAE